MGALTPKLNGEDVAGAGGAAGVDVDAALPKKSGMAAPPLSFGLSASDGLPRPSPGPAVFFGASMFPNKAEAGGAAGCEPRLEKKLLAGGLPAGVVEPAAGAVSGTKPPVAGAAAGGLVGDLGGAAAGGDSGCATRELPARGEEARGRC